MSKKPLKVPDADHPITIERTARRTTAHAGQVTIADSAAALVLREAGHPPVHYFPRTDVDQSLLERTDHATYCPYKGECSYFSIRIGDEVLANAVWTYERPYDAVRQIKEYLAFYPDRVSISERD